MKFNTKENPYRNNNFIMTFDDLLDSTERFIPEKLFHIYDLILGENLYNDLPFLYMANYEI